MKSQFRILLAIMLAVFGLLAAAQSPAAKPSSVPAGSAEKTAGEMMKNVQVLKDVPASEWSSVMTFISGSLGVSCEHCHAQPFDSDAKEAKKTARSMMKMVHEINAANFEGRAMVTCNSCHRGSLEPQSMPGLWSKTAEELAAYKKQRETDRAGTAVQATVTKPESLPPADQTFANYRKAVGPSLVKSIHLVGAINGEIQQPISLEVDAVLPDKFFVRNSAPGGVEFRTIANGERGWNISAQGTREIPAPGIEGLKQNFNRIVEPVKYVQVQATGKLVGTEKILERIYTVVESNTATEFTRLYFDTQSGLLYKARVERRVPGFGASPAEVIFEDYREVNGVKFPFSITSTSSTDRVRLKISDIQTNVTVDPSKFEAPPKPTAAK